MQMFALFRINYDDQNWQMLVKNLIFNHKVKFIFGLIDFTKKLIKNFRV